MTQVRRTNLNTDLYRLLSLESALEELAAQTGADEYDSRMDIMARLCAGEAIEVGIYRYTLEG